MKERAIIQLFSFTHLSLSSFLASFCLSDPRLISKALIERSQHQLLRERARETADWLIFSEPRTSSFQKQIAFFFFFFSRHLLITAMFTAGGRGSARQP